MTINIHTCKRCAHEWASRNKAPKMCPRCKSPNWQTVKRPPKWKRDLDAANK